MSHLGLPLRMDASTPYQARRSEGLPARGWIIAGIVTGFGVALTCSMPGAAIGVGNVGIIAAMVAVALIGAKEARRLMPVEGVEEAAGAEQGAWMSVVVGHAGPSETAGAITRPKAPPRHDPERRSLFRRAGERRRAVGAERR